MHIEQLGIVDYLETQQAMQQFVANVSPETEDQIWLLQHQAVYTQGIACKVGTLVASDIPVVKSDRGGQITYHGPGQLVMYVLLNLKRHHLNVKSLVNNLEQCVIDFLAEHGVDAQRKEGAPGVYVDGAKIAALGLRVKKGFSYHGLSFNVDMDLSPFSNIDPCGYQGMPVTQLTEVISVPSDAVLEKVAERLLKLFQDSLKV